MKSEITATHQATPTRKPTLSEASLPLSRRRFLKAAAQMGALLAAPQIVRGAVLGRDGGVAPSERIVLGGIGIGNRGTYDLGCFLEQPDVQFVAICDVKAARREAVKKKADQQIRQPGLRHVPRFARPAGPQRHRRRADRHRPELARYGSYAWRPMPARMCIAKSPAPRTSRRA